MMTALAYIHADLKRLHKALDAALELPPEQLHAVPGGPGSSANTIAWDLWHVARTEDNVVRFILQNRRPTVWQEGGYPDKLGLPPVAQGTGMTAAEAQALRIKDVPLFREYMQKAWASTDEFLASVDPEALDKPVTLKPLGEMPGVRALGMVCLTHGFSHVGEIDLAKTLVGAAR